MRSAREPHSHTRTGSVNRDARDTTPCHWLWIVHNFDCLAFRVYTSTSLQRSGMMLFLHTIVKYLFNNYLVILYGRRMTVWVCLLSSSIKIYSIMFKKLCSILVSHKRCKIRLKRQ